MEAKNIAPCGMNCGVCINFQARKLDINTQGFHKTYCPGCIERGKNCTFMKKHCDLIGEGKIRFCYQCDVFPCDRLKRLDKRYREKYHLSMIENLHRIQNDGMDTLLAFEEAKWKCDRCGGEITCHSGLCLKCDLEILKNKKTYCWDDDSNKQTKMKGKTL